MVMFTTTPSADVDVLVIGKINFDDLAVTGRRTTAGADEALWLGGFDRGVGAKDRRSVNDDVVRPVGCGADVSVVISGSDNEVWCGEELLEVHIRCDGGRSSTFVHGQQTFCRGFDDCDVECNRSRATSAWLIGVDHARSANPVAWVRSASTINARSERIEYIAINTVAFNNCSGGTDRRPDVAYMASNSA
jgi:hypothetical protein